MSRKRIGLIAGNGSLPRFLAESARAQGCAVFAVAHEKETDPLLAEKVDDLLWVSIGQVEPILAYFKKQEVSEIVMAGGIPKTYLFHAKRDRIVQTLLSSLEEKKDDLLLRTFASVLERDGIKVAAVTDYLPSLLSPVGEMTRPITEREQSDIAWGKRLAKQVGMLDIGQTIVVKDGVILAVEACEGTNAAIVRGGQWAESTVVIKCKKPHQDTRFDLPTVGLQTIATMMTARASVLAIEARATLILDKAETLKMAEGAGIAVVGWEEGACPERG